MPEIKPRFMKSLQSIDNEPQRMTPRITAIIYMDVAGKGTNDIAKELGLTASRISIIKGSPMYKERRDIEAKKMEDMYLDKQTNRFTTDPVQKIFQEAAENAAKKQVKLIEEGSSDFIKLNASEKVLENSGYKSKHDVRPPAIKVENKVFNRFIEVAEHASKRPSNNDRCSVGGDTEAVS